MLCLCVCCAVDFTLESLAELTPQVLSAMTVQQLAHPGRVKLLKGLRVSFREQVLAGSHQAELRGLRALLLELSRRPHEMSLAQMAVAAHIVQHTSHLSRWLPTRAAHTLLLSL